MNIHRFVWKGNMAVLTNDQLRWRVKKCVLCSCFSFRRVWKFSKEKVEQKRKRIFPWFISAYSYTQFICHPSQLNFWIVIDIWCFQFHPSVHSWHLLPPHHTETAFVWVLTTCLLAALRAALYTSGRSLAPRHSCLSASGTPSGFSSTSGICSSLSSLLIPFSPCTFWVPQGSDSSLNPSSGEFLYSYKFKNWFVLMMFTCIPLARMFPTLDHVKTLLLGICPWIFHRHVEFNFSLFLH